MFLEEAGCFRLTLASFYKQPLHYQDVLLFLLMVGNKESRDIRKFKSPNASISKL